MNSTPSSTPYLTTAQQSSLNGGK
ncbi:hypothetical protein A2U01_0116267, partial [Trifolium medium]|nr:hypothetical protein [Trifolium medium]